MPLTGNSPVAPDCIWMSKNQIRLGRFRTSIQNRFLLQKNLYSLEKAALTRMGCHFLEVTHFGVLALNRSCLPDPPQQAICTAHNQKMGNAEKMETSMIGRIEPVNSLFVEGFQNRNIGVAITVLIAG